MLKPIEALEADIAKLRSALTALRRENPDAATEKVLLAKLARLQAERLRLMRHPRSRSN
jgi:hypothetical protein